MKIQLTDKQKLLLQHLQCTDNRVVITAQLDRSDYKELNKVLEGLGGKWNRKEKAHIFPENAAAIIQDAFTGEIKTDVFKSEEVKKIRNFFATPQHIIDMMLEMSPEEGREQMRVLEPSFGDGRIGRALSQAGYKCVTGVELDPDLYAMGKDFFTEHHNMDFLDYRAQDEQDKFDLILMNPPFSKNQYIHHIDHAVSLLKWGGRLLAIAPTGYVHNTNKATTLLKNKLKSFVHYAEYHHPAESFRDSGTLISTLTISVTKKYPDRFKE